MKVLLFSNLCYDVNSKKRKQTQTSSLFHVIYDAYVKQESPFPTPTPTSRQAKCLCHRYTSVLLLNVYSLACIFSNMFPFFHVNVVFFFNCFACSNNSALTYLLTNLLNLH